MASTNGSGRPPGCVSIPVEIVREPNSSSSLRHNAPFQTFHNDNPYGRFSDSSSWNRNFPSRFQRHPNPNTAYDRVISNSQFNQPLYSQFQEPQQRLYEPLNPFNFSRSSEDLLSSPFDSRRRDVQPQYSSLIPPSSLNNRLQNDSDFFQPNKYSVPLRRSYDALNDYTDMNPTTQQYPFEQQPPFYRSSYQTQHQPRFEQQTENFMNPNITYTNEYGSPVDPYQPSNIQGTGNSTSNDHSRSSSSQRDLSSMSQQEEEPELKMAKDTDGPIPMPAPVSSSSPAQSADQHVPLMTTNVPSPSESVQDPNAIALEKLEQIKESLDILEQQVDLFTGSTRYDRTYKRLDEQALKIMIRCDELVDVCADIKEKRKEMIRNVQRVITKLESKVPGTPAIEQNSNPMELVVASADESSDNNHNEENIEKEPSTTPEESISTSIATEQSIST